MAEEGSSAAIQEPDPEPRADAPLRLFHGGDNGDAGDGDRVRGELPRRHEGEIRREPGVPCRRPPETIRQIVVPRLILQPFIENCFKYGTTARPPWRIELRGGCVGRAVVHRDPRQRARFLGGNAGPHLRAAGRPPAGRQRTVPDVDLGDGNRQFLREAEACLR